MTPTRRRGPLVRDPYALTVVRGDSCPLPSTLVDGTK